MRVQRRCALRPVVVRARRHGRAAKADYAVRALVELAADTGATGRSCPIGTGNGPVWLHPDEARVYPNLPWLSELGEQDDQEDGGER